MAKESKKSRKKKRLPPPPPGGSYGDPLPLMAGETHYDREELQTGRELFRVYKAFRLIDMVEAMESLVKQYPALPRHASDISNEQLTDLIDDVHKGKLLDPPPEFFSQIKDVIPPDELEVLVIEVGNWLVFRPLEEVVYTVILLLWQTVILREYERRRDEVENRWGKALRKYLVGRFNPSFEKVEEVLKGVRKLCTRKLWWHSEFPEWDEAKKEIAAEANLRLEKRTSEYRKGVDPKRMLHSLEGKLNKIPGNVRDDLRYRLEKSHERREVTGPLPAGFEGESAEEWREKRPPKLPKHLTEVPSPELKILVEEILEQLPEKEKVLLEMLFEGQTQKEIADRLEISQPAVSQQIRKLRSKLSFLKNDDTSSSQ